MRNLLHTIQLTKIVFEFYLLTNNFHIYSIRRNTKLINMHNYLTFFNDKLIYHKFIVTAILNSIFVSRSYARS